MDAKARKSRPVPVRVDRAAGPGISAPRRTHPPRARDRRPPLRDSCNTRSAPRSRWIHCWNRRSATATAASKFLAAPPAGSGTVAHHHLPTRRSHRAPQARKPASHRNHAVAGTGSARPAKTSRHDIGLHAVSLPQTTRSLGKQSFRFCWRARSPSGPNSSNQIWQSGIRSSAPTSSAPAAARYRPTWHATLDDASRLIPHLPFSSCYQPGAGCLPGLSAPSHCRPRSCSRSRRVSIPADRRSFKTWKRWPRSGWNGWRISAHPKCDLCSSAVRAGRRNPERPLPASGLRDHYPPHRLWLIRLCTKVIPDTSHWVFRRYAQCELETSARHDARRSPHTTIDAAS